MNIINFQALPSDKQLIETEIQSNAQDIYTLGCKKNNNNNNDKKNLEVISSVFKGKSMVNHRHKDYRLWVTCALYTVDTHFFSTICIQYICAHGVCINDAWLISTPFFLMYRCQKKISQGQNDQQESTTTTTNSTTHITFYIHEQQTSQSQAVVSTVPSSVCCVFSSIIYCQLQI